MVIHMRYVKQAIDGPICRKEMTFFIPGEPHFWDLMEIGGFWEDTVPLEDRWITKRGMVHPKRRLTVL